MKIILIGYMASGKSTVGKILADKLRMSFIDLDATIEKSLNLTIPEIFKNRGEIYFRKQENSILKNILKTKDNFIMATGGGTPCYGDSLKMMLENEKTLIVYLRTPISLLAKRLFKEKSERPLISHLKSMEDLSEFIGIHIFERSSFYNQAEIIIDIKSESEEKVAETILTRINEYENSERNS